MRQSLTFPRPCVDLSRNAGPQDLVFFLQEFDIPGELAVYRGGDEGQQWMENLHRGGIVETGIVERPSTFVVHRLDRP